MVIQGSCCCGLVKFELLEAPTMMATCHCSRCRIVGASTFVMVSRSALRWVRGREAVARYTPDPPFKFARCFCSGCGTALGEIDSEADTFPISAHALDDDPQVRVRFHEFVAVKPAWYDICDSAKQFAQHPG